MPIGNSGTGGGRPKSGGNTGGDPTFGNGIEGPARIVSLLAIACSLTKYAHAAASFHSNAQSACITASSLASRDTS